MTQSSVGNNRVKNLDRYRGVVDWSVTKGRKVVVGMVLFVVCQ
jgi:hypothetical protein